MFDPIGWPELLVIMAVASCCLEEEDPGDGEGLGEGIRNFKTAMKGDTEKDVDKTDRLEDPIQKVRRPLLPAQAI